MSNSKLPKQLVLPNTDRSPDALEYSVAKADKHPGTSPNHAPTPAEQPAREKAGNKHLSSSHDKDEVASLVGLQSKTQPVSFDLSSEPPLMAATAVADYFGVSVATIWRWNKCDPQFPEPIYIGQKTTRWLRRELDDHVNQRASARPKSNASAECKSEKPRTELSKQGRSA